MTTNAIALSILVLAASCGTDSYTPPSDLDEEGAYGVTGLRRLTRSELTSALGDVFGVPADDLASLLPEDQVGDNPFDNSYEAQTVSPLVVGAYGAFAQQYAAKLAADAELAQRIGGCTPSGASDAGCFEAVMRAAGRRLFRRPLTQAELDAYGARLLPFAAETGSFGTAIETFGMLVAQHPEVLYRVEGGAGGGLVKLGDYEVATRMSFLLWGSVPDDALLDAAKDGKLADAKHRVAHAERMLADPRARRQWQRFHAQWLGYSVAPLPMNLAADLTDETARLIDRVIFEADADWLALFNWGETFVTPQLATHYELTPVTQPGWVAYPPGRGGGVLTHGSFLTLGAKFGDTSPTVRGYEIFKRLTCGKLGTIPLTVDTTMPPGVASDCKPERYVMRNVTGCDACHSITDNIGFGLENFGVAGAWRTTEPNKPQCGIDAQGSWAGTAFSGPEELGRLIAEDPRVSACATTQLFRFMTGRDETADDEATLRALDQTYQDRRSLQALLLELVRSPAIAYRKGA